MLIDHIFLWYFFLQYPGLEAPLRWGPFPDQLRCEWVRQGIQKIAPESTTSHCTNNPGDASTLGGTRRD